MKISLCAALLLPSLAFGQVNISGTAVEIGGSSGGSGPTLQTNGVNTTTQSLADFINSVTNSTGLTVTFSNPSGGQIQSEIGGSLVMTSLAGFTSPAAGDVAVYNSGWTKFAGNNSGTQCFTENASGVPAWASCGAGSAAFSALTSGTNTAATMNVGTGASIGTLGTGTIAATSVGGVTVTGTPSLGQVLTATSSSAANWQAIPAAPASNLLGGALGSLPYQSATNVTTFIAGPTTSGHTFVPCWQPAGSLIAPTACDLATYLASPPAIGSGTPNAITVSTLNGHAIVQNTTITVANGLTVNANSADVVTAHTVSMPGLTASCVVVGGDSSDSLSVAGFGTTGGLVIKGWPSTNTFNYRVVNQTATAITISGGPITFNLGAVCH